MRRAIFSGIIIGVCFLGLTAGSQAKEIWCNPANTGIEDGLTKSTGYKTLWKAISAMASGDTVIIVNGDWTSYPDMYMDNYHMPPSGTTDNYSTIEAETDWEVRLPYISIAIGRCYVEIRGIVFDSRKNPMHHIVYDWHHAKFIRCGFLAGKLGGNAHTCGFGSPDSSRLSNHHNLMEECIAWGGGRYVFYNKYGQYNIFRRCVARHDYNAQDAEQIFNFRAYACDYAIYQNCISIDSDRTQYYSTPLCQESGGFWLGDQYGATGNEAQGCISIKDVIMSYYICGAGDGNSVVKNSAALDITIPGYTTLTAFVLKSSTNVNVSNFLGLGGLGAGFDGFYGKNSGNFAVRDSIVKDVAEYGIGSAGSSYINHYNANKTLWCNWGEGCITYDPQANGLLYPVRIESGSSLAAAGSGGSVCGPVILKKIGISGTLYGEEGWDSVTEENLWPFPNEDKIKELMSQTVEGVSGIYGFTAYESPFGSPNTLTSYIWEYLGNPIPPEIYGEEDGKSHFGVDGLGLKLDNLQKISEINDGASGLNGFTWGVFETSPGCYSTDKEKQMEEIKGNISQTGRKLQLNIQPSSNWAVETVVEGSEEDIFPRIDPATGESCLLFKRIKPEYLDEWGAFIKHVVRNSNASCIQIGSEPENEWYSVDGFVEALQIAYAAAKEENPEIIVMASGFNTAEFFGLPAETQKDWMTNIKCSHKISFIQEFIAKAKNHFDVLAYHANRGYTYIPPTVDWLENQMNNNGYQKPIWFDDMMSARYLYLDGVFQNSEDIQTFNDLKNEVPSVVQEYRAEQSGLVVKKSVVSFASGVERVFMSSDTDWPTYYIGEWQNTGLLDINGNPKPAFYTAKIIVAKLDKFISAEKINDNIYKFSFIDKKPVFVLWNEDGNKLIDLSSYFSASTVRITCIITELDANNDPICLPDKTVSVESVQLNETPIFAEEAASEKSDINSDDKVDVLDVQICVNVLLDVETDANRIKAAKAVAVPEDKCDVLDVQAVVNGVLAG